MKKTIFLFCFCLLILPLYAQMNNESIRDKFTADTCKIESNLSLETEIWPNHESYIFMLQKYGYEDLISKYTSILYDRLNDADKILFIKSSTAWDEYYSSQVSFLVYNVQFSAVDMFIARIVKERAIEIYNYLLLLEGKNRIYPKN